MALSKKHFCASARILSALLEKSTGPALMNATQAALQFADFFASDAPKFDRARFLKACGVVVEEPGGHCAECGEVWPCSDSKRRDIMPTIVAKHRRA